MPISYHFIPFHLMFHHFPIIFHHFPPFPTPSRGSPPPWVSSPSWPPAPWPPAAWRLCAYRRPWARHRGLSFWYIGRPWMFKTVLKHVKRMWKTSATCSFFKNLPYSNSLRHMIYAIPIIFIVHRSDLRFSLFLSFTKHFSFSCIMHENMFNQKKETS
jgi:hypothetical protein